MSPDHSDHRGHGHGHDHDPIAEDVRSRTLVWELRSHRRAADAGRSEEALRMLAMWSVFAGASLLHLVTEKLTFTRSLHSGLGPGTDATAQAAHAWRGWRNVARWVDAACFDIPRALYLDRPFQWMASRPSYWRARNELASNIGVPLRNLWAAGRFRLRSAAGRFALGASVPWITTGLALWWNPLLLVNYPLVMGMSAAWGVGRAFALPTLVRLSRLPHRIKWMQRALHGEGKPFVVFAVRKVERFGLEHSHGEFRRFFRNRSRAIRRAIAGLLIARASAPWSLSSPGNDMTSSPLLQQPPRLARWTQLEPVPKPSGCDHHEGPREPCPLADADGLAHRSQRSKVALRCARYRLRPDGSMPSWFSPLRAVTYDAASIYLSGRGSEHQPWLSKQGTAGELALVLDRAVRIDPHLAPYINATRYPHSSAMEAEYQQALSTRRQSLGFPDTPLAQRMPVSHRKTAMRDAARHGALMNSYRSDELVARHIANATDSLKQDVWACLRDSQLSHQGLLNVPARQRAPLADVLVHAGAGAEETSSLLGELTPQSRRVVLRSLEMMSADGALTTGRHRSTRSNTVAYAEVGRSL